MEKGASDHLMQVDEASVPVASAETGKFLNRELGWLEFNRRVLHEALDERTPLLERVRFLAIFSSNLDEFIMKRVGRLRERVAHNVVSLSLDRLTPAQEMAAIRERLLPMLKEHSRCFSQSLVPALREHGLFLLHWDELTKEQRAEADRIFREKVFSILTPLSVDPGHPFPFISNLSTSLGVFLRYPEKDEVLFARIKIPQTLPMWLRLETGLHEGEIQFASLLSVIQQNVFHLFPGMLILDSMPFRVTRNADIDRGDEEEVEDLLEMVEEELRQRRFADAVRLEVGPNANVEMVQILLDELELSENDIYEVEAGLEVLDLDAIAEVNLPELLYPVWNPAIPPRLSDEEADIFSIIRNGDLLVHHPFDSFHASVERFLRTAVEDPKTLAIKMTVYRTGEASSFIPLLIQAAEEGKQVVCLVELKARFDEKRNIYSAQQLEKAGVHVVYGIVGFKTHMKTILVVRQEADGLRCYAHIGTGNYHAETARLYTDLGLLTCDPEIAGDLVELFHYITGRSLKNDYKKLLVAPVNMRERFIEMIDREIEHQKSGRPAHIVAKMNSLHDEAICESLYRASKAGVPVDLIVRGFCILRPGVPGLSENIRVISIIGRFLEHSRIFYTRNGTEDPAGGEFFIGSSDWMFRNLSLRVEAIVPVEDPLLRPKLWEILQISLEDQRQAWDMKTDGTYVQRVPKDESLDVGAQTRLAKMASQESYPSTSSIQLRRSPH